MMRTWTVAGAVVAAIAALTWSHTFMFQAGKQAERESALSRSIEVLRDRSMADDEISRMDDAELCRALGGVFTDGTCQ